MQTWLDLEARFRALAEPLKSLRLDANWEERFVFRHETAGVPQDASVREFKALCGIAGRLLQRALDAQSDVGKMILRELDPVERWYVWLVRYSESLDEISPHCEVDDQGNGWWVYSGTIYNLAAVSANQCLELEARFPIRDDRKWHHRVYNEYGREIVIGTILTVVALLLGLFFGG